MLSSVLKASVDRRNIAMCARSSAKAARLTIRELAKLVEKYKRSIKNSEISLIVSVENYVSRSSSGKEAHRVSDMTG
jgi:hypothetical protein